MNTSVIPTSAPTSTGAVSKLQRSDVSSTDVSFNQILTREVADRHTAENTSAPKTRDASNTNIKSESTGTASTSSSSEDSNSGDSASAAESEGSTTAEQLLMMAAQFSPSIPPATLATVTQNATEASLAIAATGASLTSEAGDILSAAQNTALQQLGKPELASIEQKPGATDKTDLNLGGFDSELSQIIDKNLSHDAGIKKENNQLTGALQQQKSIAAERLVSTLPGQVAVDLGADKTLDERPDLSASLAPMQQTIANQAQNAQGHSTDRLTPNVGTPAWNQAVGQKLVWMIGNEQQSASLTLNPPDLGPLQVVLSVSSTQANASFYSSQPEVRQALEAALPKLREMLGDAGIQLGQASVSAGTPQQQGSYGEQQASSRGLSHSRDSVVLPATALTNSTRIVRDGLIDTFA